MLNEINDRINGWIDFQLMDSHQQRKHKRIIAIASLLRRRGKVNYKTFLAQMQLNGLRKCVAEEYIDVLKDLEMIDVDDENITWLIRDSQEEKG